MSSVRFAALCDTCGKRSEEYRGWRSCAGCVEDVCDSCDRSRGAFDPLALCPACGSKNVLTPKDVALGYQCNRCADQQEGAF